MFLGYQNNKIVSYTKTRLNEVTYNLDKVEETDKVYVYVLGEDGETGEYVLYDDEQKAKELEAHRQAKYSENEQVRDTFLLSGVTYKEVVFDADTDQKINLMYAVETLGETDTINWYGKNGTSYVECNKRDLLNIGQLITLTTSYVWTERNPEIKAEIAEATSIEELDAIDISYEPVTL